MVEIDFGNIYSPTGEIIQERYAKKAIASGSTILAIRNESGVVVLAAKPIHSKLHKKNANFRIHKLAENVCLVYTGFLPDGLLIKGYCKSEIASFKKTFESEIDTATLKEYFRRYLYFTTGYSEARQIGAEFIAVIHDSGEYRILHVGSTGKVSEYSACAIGAGEKRAITELERESFERKEMLDLLDYGVKTLYKCHDALSDPEFTIEAAMISEDSDGKFRRISQDVVDEFVERYKDISMDDDAE